MANLKSSKKDIRRIGRRTSRNNIRRATVDKLMRQLKTEVNEKEKDKAQKTLQAYYKAVDKAAKNGIYKENKAARMKSAAAKLVSQA